MVAMSVVELPPRGGEAEKITINLGYVDLGHIDLLVREGFYSNRTDLIRTAIRNQLERHAAVDRSVTRQSLDLGLRHYSRADLEAVLAAGEKLRIHVLGLATIAPDVTPELAPATIDSLSWWAPATPLPPSRQPSPAAFAEPPPMSPLEKAKTMSNDPRLPDLAEAT